LNSLSFKICKKLFQNLQFLAESAKFVSESAKPLVQWVWRNFDAENGLTLRIKNFFLAFTLTGWCMTMRKNDGQMPN